MHILPKIHLKNNIRVTWCAQITTGYKEDGKLIRKTLYGKSRQEVAKKLTQYTHDVFENGYSSVATSDNKVFNQLLEEWFVTFKVPTIKSPTVSKHRNFLKNHIYKAFDNFSLYRIKTRRVDCSKVEKH